MISLDGAKQQNILTKQDVAEIKEELESQEISGNISIFTMPQRFRMATRESKESEHSGAVILLLGLIFLLVLAGGGYYYFFILKSQDGNFSYNLPIIRKPKNLPGGQGGASTTPSGDSASSTEQEAPGAGDEASIAIERYLIFKERERSVSGLADYESTVTLFGGKEFIAQAEKEKALYSQLDETEQRQYISLLATELPAIDELREGLKSAQISGNMLLLSSEKQGVSVEMILEGSEWKVESESGLYSIHPTTRGTTTRRAWLEERFRPIETPPEELLATSTDKDGDGLTAKEEEALGTAETAEDSDGDGYSDLSELEAGFNPAGPGRLSSSPKFNTYINSKYDFKIFYPSSWELVNVDQDESILIKTGDDQFMQVIIQENSGNKDIDSWYRSQFSLADIRPEQRISGGQAGEDVWQGIMSNDRLNAYLTDPGRSIIVTLAYNPGMKRESLYPNIYKYLLSSISFSR